MCVCVWGGGDHRPWVCFVCQVVWGQEPPAVRIRTPLLLHLGCRRQARLFVLLCRRLMKYEATKLRAPYLYWIGSMT